MSDQEPDNSRHDTENGQQSLGQQSLESQEAQSLEAQLQALLASTEHLEENEINDVGQRESITSEVSNSEDANQSAADQVDEADDIANSNVDRRENSGHEEADVNDLFNNALSTLLGETAGESASGLNSDNSNVQQMQYSNNVAQQSEQEGSLVQSIEQITRSLSEDVTGSVNESVKVEHKSDGQEQVLLNDVENTDSNSQNDVKNTSGDTRDETGAESSHDQLLDQVKSTMQLSEQLTNNNNDTQNDNGNSRDDLDISMVLQSALAGLIGEGSELEGSGFESQLDAIANSESEESRNKKRTSMSIAETLAASRSVIDKNRAAQSDKIDLMLQRRGFARQVGQNPAPRYFTSSPSSVTVEATATSSLSPSSSTSAVAAVNSTVVVDPLLDPALTQLSDHLLDQESSSFASVENVNDSSNNRNNIEEENEDNDDEDSNLLAALNLVKQVMSIEGDNSQHDGASGIVGEETESAVSSSNFDQQGGENNFNLNPEAVDAVQAVLQALGQSFSDDHHSFERTFVSEQEPRKARMKKSKNTVLTEEDREKIRMDNRERKKKWRGNNSDRNKDNDLRARLHRRAAQIYGREDTPEKRAWFEAEFLKRKERRLQREMSMERFDIASFTRTFNINDPTPAQSDLQSTLGNLSQNGGLNRAMNSIVKDPQLLKNLSGFFTEANKSDVPDLTTGRQQIRAVGNGGFVSTFQIKRNKPSSHSNTTISMPSRAPDKGLTSLVKSVRRANVAAAHSQQQQPSQQQHLILGQNHQPNQSNHLLSSSNGSGDDGIDSGLESNTTGTYQGEDSTDRQIRELAGMLSQAVEDSEFEHSEEPETKRPRFSPPPSAPIPNISSQLAHSVGALPKPPQYVISSNSKPRESLSKSPSADDRVMAMGFPPLLAGMTIKR